MNDQPASQFVSHEPSRLTTFARNHPVLTVIGAGGIGLLGGAELAAGILLGAAINSLVRRQSSHANSPDTKPLRATSHAILDRVPHVVRERARAVFDAARGRQPAQSEHPIPAP
jgi:hypothetical protein